MSRKYFLLLLCLGALLTFSKTEGQDLEFSQFYAAPLHLNPAMIGYSEFPRFNLNFRDQYPSFGHAFLSFAASYDQHIHKYNSSVGLSMTGDVAGRGLLSTYTVNGFYAYQLNLTPGFRVKAGFQASIIQQGINESKLIYFDQIDPNAGVLNTNIPTEEAALGRTNVTQFDLGTGLMGYSKSFFFGVAIKHLLQPKFNYSMEDDGGSKLPMNIHVHGGKTFFLNDPLFEKDQKYITLSMMYAMQKGFKQITAGGHFGRGALFGGMYFRHTIANSSSLITVFGVKKGLYRFGYSYDIGLAGLGSANGAHELSISVDLGLDPANQKKARRRDEVVCPARF